MAKKQKFLRIESHKYSRLGKRRKNKLVYRRPKGGENKIRLNRAGRLRKVKIGFKRKKSERGLIKGLKPVVIYNISDLKKVSNGKIAVVGKIGNKKRKEIAKYSYENKLKLLNLDAYKFLKDIEEKEKVKNGLRKEEDKVEVSKEVKEDENRENKENKI